MWMKYEHVIRHAAGLGKAADDHNDPDRYEKTHAHCDVLVAGGGAAGLPRLYRPVVAVPV